MTRTNTKQMTSENAKLMTNEKCDMSGCKQQFLTLRFLPSLSELSFVTHDVCLLPPAACFLPFYRLPSAACFLLFCRLPPAVCLLRHVKLRNESPGQPSGAADAC